MRLLKKLSESTTVYFMHGNRDFLIGNKFAAATGCKMLPEITKITVKGKKVLLSHGDQFLKNDKAYQVMRNIFRSTIFTKTFIKVPLKLRKKIALQARTVSSTQSVKKNNSKFIISTDAINKIWRTYNFDINIYGHLHRKSLTTEIINDKKITTAILPDWKKSHGCQLLIDTNNNISFADITVEN